MSFDFLAAGFVEDDHGLGLSRLDRGDFNADRHPVATEVGADIEEILGGIDRIRIGVLLGDVKPLADVPIRGGNELPGIAGERLAESGFVDRFFMVAMPVPLPEELALAGQVFFRADLSMQKRRGDQKRPHHRKSPNHGETPR
ncbi:MAG: hypothetical protein U0744_02345 [Gemmataceae bacterium]